MSSGNAMAGVEKPSWGKTVGVYFMSLLAMGFAAGVTSSIGLQMTGFGGYSFGGMLSWFAALFCASRYRSTGKVGASVGIAFGIGVVIGLFVIAVGPTAIAMRYGAV